MTKYSGCLQLFHKYCQCAVLSITITVRLKKIFRFGSLVGLDVVCRYLPLFLLHINIKKGKNSC